MLSEFLKATEEDTNALCITYSSPSYQTFPLLFQNTKNFNFLISSQTHFIEKDDSVKKQLISLSREFGTFPLISETCLVC